MVTVVVIIGYNCSPTPLFFFQFFLVATLEITLSRILLTIRRAPLSVLSGCYYYCSNVSLRVPVYSYNFQFFLVATIYIGDTAFPASSLLSTFSSFWLLHDVTPGVSSNSSTAFVFQFFLVATYYLKVKTFILDD